MKVIKLLLKILPYLVSCLAGFLFLLIGLRLNEDFKSLFINIAAAFLAIPFIYLFYQQMQNLIQKRLNKEIFDYAKMQIDKDILSIINQLQKVVYPLKEKDFSQTGVNKFLSLNSVDIKKIISENKYLGFQIFKKWAISEDNLHNTLNSSYMLKSLSNEHIISIISIIKNLRNLENIQKLSELYVLTDEKINSYRMISGKELNKENTQFPERYLLLKILDDQKSLVEDFGDFAHSDREKLLQIFIVNENLSNVYSEVISDLIKEINIWLELTGYEFVVDTKMFQARIQHED